MEMQCFFIGRNLNRIPLAKLRLPHGELHAELVFSIYRLFTPIDILPELFYIFFMKIYYSPQCLSYKQPGHPESPERVETTAQFLQNQGYIFLMPSPCKEEDLLLVHTPQHIESVRRGTFFDPDTPYFPEIYDIACLSVGSAISAMESASQGENAFSLMRPPGHHATRNRVMGFCYFNNIAVATALYLKKYPQHKIAILDIDVHHGNGTQDIFLGNPQVIFVSIHQHLLYPGTGLESQKNCVNFPLPPFTGVEDYFNALEKACEHIQTFEPSCLGISAGFDTCKTDPLSQFQLPVSAYKEIGEKIRKLNLPTFAVLEGGYSQDLPYCIYEFFRGLGF